MSHRRLGDRDTATVVPFALECASAGTKLHPWWAHPNAQNCNAYYKFKTNALVLVFGNGCWLPD